MRQFIYLLYVLVAFLLPAVLLAQTDEEDSAGVDVIRVEEGDGPVRTVSAIDSSVTVSLLTCSPGQETYELYGHTAIRITTKSDTMGVVYNYGVFDFRAPHFVWRFVLGECDYLLWGEPLVSFLGQYYVRGSWVREQVLNLTPEEANRLRDSLRIESRPENRVYRYNIFRNNCTTRARDIIERCINGRVEYPARAPRNTFRTILHQFTQGHEWAEEGNDILLGTEVDTLITERDEMFSPIYLMWYVDSAFIDAGRNRYRDLVRERRVLLPANANLQQQAYDALPSFPLSPRSLGWLLLVLGLCLAFFEWRRGRIWWGVDAVLMTLQGMAGILLVFLALFSVHPGVTSNWQVWVLNPIPLFFVYSVIRADLQRKRHVYHLFAAFFLALFIAFYFIIPQDFSQLTLPLALLLLSRAVVHLLVYRK